MRFTAALILSVATALALPRVGSAGQPVRMLENHFGGVAASGETVVVTGNWMLASSELSPSRPSLSVKGGDLVFAPGAKFQTDDFGPVEKFAEGAFLWKVEGGNVSGLPQIDPPSMTNSWALSVSSDGLEGRIVRIHSSVSWLADFGEQLHRCFVVNQRWKYITNGLAVTLKVALCAVLLGTLLAFLTEYSALCKALFSPVMMLVKSTPVASFIILALLWIGRTYVPLFIAALMVMPVVFGAVTTAAGSVDAGILEMARAYRFSPFKKLRLIYIPSAYPAWRSAAITAMGLAWKAGVAAEVLCQPKTAIGTELYYSKLYLETPSLFAWTAVVVLLSFLLERLFARLAGERRQP